ncbi:hypothetical protein ACVWXS_005405 [Lysinibacillus sp. TE18511]
MQPNVLQVKHPVIQQGFSIFSSTIGPVFFVFVLTVRTLIRVGRIIGETSSNFPAQVVSL